MRVAAAPAGGPFSLPIPAGDRSRLWRRLGPLLRPVLERLLGLTSLNRVYGELAGGGNDAGPFADRALAALGISYEVSGADLRRIPASGPLLVVANHPFGAADGLVLLSLLLRVRPDARLLGNYLLHRIPDLRDAILPVDPFGGPGAAGRSLVGLRRALRFLRAGGALAVFPAGEVAHLDLRRRAVAEPPWSGAIGRLARRADAPVVPIRFEGRNGPAFQILGLFDRRLRTALLPRELLRRRRPIVVRVGGPIPAARLAGLGDDAAVSEYLRVRVEVLAGREPRAAAAGEPDVAERPGAARVVAASPTVDLVREVERLPAEQRLLDSGPYDVLFARAEQAPAVVREIGRLREITFRRAGEGTGRPIDLDRFDDDYLHLFVWNRARSEVVGAYRVGPTDEILPRRGRRGLYTNTLFRLEGRLLQQIGPALELGRSFVRPDYQREHSPLTLLWRGIGLFAAARPRYRRLFGPVSISNEYSTLSRRLLISFLSLNRPAGLPGRPPRPRHPARLAPARDPDPALAGTTVRSLDGINDLIRDIEADRRGMPVLLRQYLKLDAVLLGFNVDPAFGDVLDALMLVDLTRVNRAILGRYMGRDGAAAYLAHHGVP